VPLRLDQLSGVEEAFWPVLQRDLLEGNNVSEVVDVVFSTEGEVTKIRAVSSQAPPNA